MVKSGGDGKIKDFVLSWQMKDAVQRAMDDDGALGELLQLLKEDDKSLQLRVLSALEEVLRDSDRAMKFRILREGFPLFLGLLGRDESLTGRAMGVLGRLIEGIPLPRKKLCELLEVMSDLLLRGDSLIWLDAIDVISKLRPPLPEDAVRYLIPLLDSGDPGSRSVGIRLSLLLENPTTVGWLKILDVLSELLKSSDPLIVSTALDSVMSILASPYELPMEHMLRMLYSPLKEIPSSDHDAFIKARAREAVTLFYSAVGNYYRSHPDDGRELAARLMKEGLVEEAMFVALAAGQVAVPSFGSPPKLANMLSEGTFPFPRFLRG